MLASRFQVACRGIGKHFVMRHLLWSQTARHFYQFHFISIARQSIRAMSTQPSIKTVGVVGMGLMGHGIAQMAAEKFNVIVFDANADALAKGQTAIEQSLTKVWSKKLPDDAEKAGQMVKERMDKIQAIDGVDGFKDCDIVVEAIIENLDIKKDFYANLGKVCKEDAILASNTSSFPIHELATASGKHSRL